MTFARLAVVGPGRLGTVLAVTLQRAGIEVAAAAGGGEPARARFGRRFPGAHVSRHLDRIHSEVDLVLLCTPDDVLEQVVADLARSDLLRRGQRVVHVSGVLGLEALRPAELAGAATAACHPAQTVPDAEAEPDILTGAAWAVTTRSTHRGWAHELVRLTGGIPYDVADDRRALYHAGLVVGSNALGAVLAAARQLLLAAGIDRPDAFLVPLVAATTGNVADRGATAITGPVRRGDVGTVRRHLDAIGRDLPELAEVYRALVAVTSAQVRPLLPPGAADEFDALTRAATDPDDGTTT